MVKVENNNLYKDVPKNGKARVCRVALLAFGLGGLFGQFAIPMAAMNMELPNNLNGITQKSPSRMELVKKKYGPIKNIALLGERNSGTRWFTEELRTCFESENIQVTDHLTKDKHFFQKDDATVPRVTTYVVSMFRNPYDWAAAMSKRPHHSPEHLKLDMQTFLTKPWTMERPIRDLPYKKVPGPICQLGYNYNEVVPCLRLKKIDPDFKLDVNFTTGYSARDPQYELRQDGSGLPYDSILHLRGSKIRNILAIEKWDWIAGVSTLRYEDQLEQGTKGFMKKMETILGVKMQCKPSPPAPERLGGYELEPKMTKLINSLVNWDIEKKIGYERRT